MNCGLKRCLCGEEGTQEMAALVHARTVITRWLRNDLGFGIDAGPRMSGRGVKMKARFKKLLLKQEALDEEYETLETRCNELLEPIEN